MSNVRFQNPGGNSALRLATKSNPRNLPCGTCGRENQLTPADKAKGYQCDFCADEAEGGMGHTSSCTDDSEEFDGDDGMSDDDEAFEEREEDYEDFEST